MFVVQSLDPLRIYMTSLSEKKPIKIYLVHYSSQTKCTVPEDIERILQEQLLSTDWDYNSACVTYQLYLQRPDLVHVEPEKFTTPDCQNRHLLWDTVIDWRQLNVIHVMTHKIEASFLPENIKRLNKTFGEVMRFVYYGSLIQCCKVTILDTIEISEKRVCLRARARARARTRVYVYVFVPGF